MMISGSVRPAETAHHIEDVCWKGLGVTIRPEVTLFCETPCWTLSPVLLFCLHLPHLLVHFLVCSLIVLSVGHFEFRCCHSPR